MRVAGHLWFSTLVLVALVCVLLPAIGFVFRRKWRLAVARKEEIKRLLILAAEETARAEREESFAYGAAAVSAAKRNHCAVCYVPATRRCAQCKSVRYCSFECQTVHWRQGHKFECLRSTTHQSGDFVSDLGKKAAEQDLSRIPAENSESEGTLCKTPNENLPISDTSLYPKESWGMNANVRVESPAEENITYSNSELSSNSFSGFSASTNGSESSDDSSVCESIISNEHEQSEEHAFVDSTLDIADGTSGDNNSVGLALPPSPKFASLVDSVDGFSTMHKLIHSKPCFSRAEPNLLSNGTSGSSMWKGKTIGPSAVYSGFWDKTLDSSGIKDDANDDTPPSRSDESTGNKESDPGIEANDSVYDDVSPKSDGNNMPSPGPASSENDRMNSLKSTNLSIMNSKGSNVTSYVTVCGSVSNQLEPKDSSRPSSSCFSSPSTLLSIDSSCADALSIHNLHSVVSVVSNHDVGNHSSTLKSAEIRCLTHELARSEGHSKSSTKHVNNSIQSSTDTSSQGVSCSANPNFCLKTSVLKVVDQFRGSNLSKRFPLAVAVGSDTAGRCSDKGLFPYDLFVKIYNLNKVELRPFGLINCGNSCYANAVLQCLAFSPPLTAYFLQGLHSKACANKKCFTCEFESLILKSKDTKSPLSPKGILSTLQSTGSQLGNGREEDAHEFLRHVIDTMQQSICLMDGRVNESGSLEEDTTLMGLTFGGFLRSKIKCMKCGGKSERQERMMDLTVEIEGEIATLEEALQRFTSTEALDGENKYRCVRCKSYEKAKKKLTVSEAPNVLTIALKRFQSGKFGKLNKPIKFPEKLDLAPFVSGTSDKSPIYRLYGVVVHLDIMNAAFSGHYVCYVKNIQNKWFKVDDSVVTAVDLERVLMKGAYMLFYARCSPRAPRLIRSRIASPDSKSKVNGKTITTKPRRHISTDSAAAAEYITSSNSPDVSPTSIDSLYSKFHHLKRILEDDSSSDNSSLISSNSDEGSCSTDSTHDSTSIDDFSDYIFGDSGHGWKSSESDTPSSTSSSPLNSRHSPLSDIDRYDSVSPDAAGSRIPTGSSADIDGPPLYRNRVVDVEKKVGDVPLPHSDTSHHRKVDISRINSNNNFRETNHFNVINSGVCCIKSRERTGQ